jgi:hypothetical protein
MVNQERETMKVRTIFAAFALVAAVCFGNWAKADETLKYRLIMHITQIQTLEVGDVEGHTMSVLHYSGLASFADGSVGTANLTAETDYIKGSGTFTAYYTVALKDGSTITYKSTNAPARLDGSITNFPEAPVSIVRGSGRFNGATGDGAGSGQRLTPLTVGAELYIDVTLNVKK